MRPHCAGGDAQDRSLAKGLDVGSEYCPRALYVLRSESSTHDDYDGRQEEPRVDGLQVMAGQLAQSDWDVGGNDEHTQRGRYESRRRLPHDRQRRLLRRLGAQTGAFPPPPSYVATSNGPVAAAGSSVRTRARDRALAPSR